MNYIVGKFFEKPGHFLTWLQQQVTRESEPVKYTKEDFSVTRHDARSSVVKLGNAVIETLIGMLKDSKHEGFNALSGEHKQLVANLLENLTFLSVLASKSTHTYRLQISMKHARALQVLTNKLGTSWQKSVSRFWVYHAYSFMTQEELSAQTKVYFSYYAGKKGECKSFADLRNHDLRGSEWKYEHTHQIDAMPAYFAIANFLQNEKFCKLLAQEDERTWDVVSRQIINGRVYRALRVINAFGHLFTNPVVQESLSQTFQFESVEPSIADLQMLERSELENTLTQLASSDPAVFAQVIQNILLRDKNPTEEQIKVWRVLLEETSSEEDLRWLATAHAKSFDLFTVNKHFSSCQRFLNKESLAGIAKDLWAQHEKGIWLGMSLAPRLIGAAIVEDFKNAPDSSYILSHVQSHYFLNSVRHAEFDVNVKKFLYKELFETGVSVAIIKALLKDPRLQEAEQFVKIAVPFIYFRELANNLSATIEGVIAKAKEEVKGWYDLSKVLPVRIQWILIENRSKKKEIEANAFMASVVSILQARDTLELDNPMFKFSPYDARGGFSFNTFLAICDKYKINAWTNCDEFYEYYPWDSEYSDEDEDKPYDSKNAVSFKIAAMRLAYLYGNDHAAAIAAIEAEISAKRVNSERGKKLAIHKMGDFLMVAMPVDTIRAWRPFLIKYPKLLKLACFLNKAQLPQEHDTEAELIQRLMANRYENVPAHLLKHMLHALENGWTQDVVDDFVEEAENNASDKKLIPNIVFHMDGVKVRHLENKDATALYVGELSGCCQHINDGAGDSAARQSYSEDWCSVLMIESASSDKLLAQSFIWLSDNKKYVILDSIESVLDETNDPSVKKLIYPALVAWVEKLGHLGYKVGVSTTSYGITDQLVRLLKRDPNIELIERETPDAMGELDYTDVDDMVYRIQIKKK